MTSNSGLFGLIVLALDLLRPATLFQLLDQLPVLLSELAQAAGMRDLSLVGHAVRLSNQLVM